MTVEDIYQYRKVDDQLMLNWRATYRGTGAGGCRAGFLEPGLTWPDQSARSLDDAALGAIARVAPPYPGLNGTNPTANDSC